MRSCGGSKNATAIASSETKDYHLAATWHPHKVHTGRPMILGVGISMNRPNIMCWGAPTNRKQNLKESAGAMMYAWIVHTNKEMPKKNLPFEELVTQNKTTTMTISTIQWALWAQWAQCLLSPFLTATVGSFPWLQQYKTHNHHPPSRWKRRVTGSTCSTRCCTQRVPVWKESLDIVGVAVTLLGTSFRNVFDLQKLISWKTPRYSGCFQAVHIAHQSKQLTHAGWKYAKR